MLVTKQWMERQYRKYNKLIFHGEMPKCEFKICYHITTRGFALRRLDRYCITMSNYWDVPEWVQTSIFVHEMIHIYDFSRPNRYTRKYIDGDNHGEHFFKPMQRMIETKYYIPCNLNPNLVWKVSKVNPDVLKGKVMCYESTDAVEKLKKNGLLPAYYHTFEDENGAKKRKNEKILN